MKIQIATAMLDQSINYVECHDNATTFDKFAISNGDEPLETRKKRQLMLNVALILSQGGWNSFYSLWSRVLS